MASLRVAHMLEEIAQLSREEQAELVRDLLRTLGSDGGELGNQSDAHGRLTMEAVQQAVETRE